MKTLDGSIEGIRLIGAEEKITAFAAVHEFKGEIHPLLTPALLSDPENEGEEATVYEGEEAAVIVESLWALSRDESSSYQPAAAWMISTLMNGEPPEDYQYPLEVTESPVHIARSELPEVNEFVVVDGHLELSCLRQRIAALRAVEEFAGRFTAGHFIEAVTEKFVRKKLIAMLSRDIDGMDLSGGTPTVYMGIVAKEIRHCLERAAKRGETHYDALAAQMLEPPLSDQPVLEPGPSTSDNLLYLSGGHVV